MRRFALPSLNSRRSSSDNLIYTPVRRNAQRGWGLFLRRNLSIVVAFLAGISCTAAVIGFTFWLSRQILQCPDWSVHCVISKNIGTVQGLMTALYAIGLATLAYTTHALSETALWPIINKQSMTIKEMETYLQASRGSIASTPFVLSAARNANSFVVILCIVTVTFLPLTGAPIMGYVYNLRNTTVPFESFYQPGGGIGPPFIQKSPLESYRDAHSTLYNSWALRISEEPMPEYREWFVDRMNLSSRGDMTVDAIRLQQNIVCSSWELKQPAKNGTSFVFETKMAEHSRPDNRTNDRNVLVRANPQMAVWAHDFRFLTPTRTVTTLVFAALNGTIEGGTTMPLNHDKIRNISSLSCDVDIDLRNARLVVGKGAPHISTINSVDHLLVGRPNVTLHKDRHRYDPKGPNTLNELALWFGVAPITAGASLFGAVPMWMYIENDLPRRYTSSNDGYNSGWTKEYIEQFIRICVGSAAQAESRIWPDGEPVLMTSHAWTNKLNPKRVPLLFILPLIIVASSALLAIWNARLHRNLDLPTMRKATLSEILKSAQTDDIIREAGEEMIDPTQPSKLKDFRVRFNEAEDGVWGLRGEHSKGGWSRLPVTRLESRESVSRSESNTSYSPWTVHEHI